MPLALHTAPDTTPVGQAPFNGQFPLSTGSPPLPTVMEPDLPDLTGRATRPG